MNQREIRREAREIVAAGAATLANDEWHPDEWHPNEWWRATFLGTVFNLMPSGKFYMPWASGNVDPCSHCKGNGCDYCGHTGSREVYEDEMMWAALEHYAWSRGLVVEHSEGDPCDILLSEYRDGLISGE